MEVQFLFWQKWVSLLGPEAYNILSPLQEKEYKITLKIIFESGYLLELEKKLLQGNF